jgi:cytochrome P450
MLVLSRMFGMPEEVGPRLVEACTGLIKGGEKAMAYHEYINEVLGELTEQKRASPSHDFASWLIAHPEGLDSDEILNHLRLVLIAANETTTNLIANTLRVVLTDPRFRASLTGGLMTIPDAVEQVLWNEPPLMVCPGRFATGDMEFGGQQIKQGDLLVLGLAAGNADPEVRPDPDTPVHGNRSHLAFNRGPHECPGQDIGRAIADTGIDALLSRLPDIRLGVEEEELRWKSTLMSRHLVALPVEFTPRKPEPLDPLPAPPATEPEAAAEAAPEMPPAEQVAERVSWWRALTRRLLGR